MMNDTVQSIHLVLECLGGSFHGVSSPSPEPISSTDPIETLKIRDGVSYLSMPPRKPPSLKRRIRGTPHDLIVLQPLPGYAPPKLLMLIPESVTVNVNGAPAPPVSLLNEKDEISFDRFSRYVLHVTLYHESRIGPPKESEIGTKCPICRSRFTRDTIVYRCQNCSKPLHNEEDKKKPEKKRLECAKICSWCPTCQAEIEMNAGYRYLPEFITK